MTAATPIERIVAILKEAGYRELGLPLTISSVPFDFAAALVGTGKAADLIVVVDTVQDSESRTQQKIDGLGRALDVAGSRRPLTAVLAGPRPLDPTLEAIARICRVLPVGTPTGEDADQLLREWLAVLLPLRLPHLGEAVADTTRELAINIPRNLEPALQTSILEAAPNGTAAVREALRRLVVEPLDDNDAPSQEDETL